MLVKIYENKLEVLTLRFVSIGNVSDFLNSIVSIAVVNSIPIVYFSFLLALNIRLPRLFSRMN